MSRSPSSDRLTLCSLLVLLVLVVLVRSGLPVLVPVLVLVLFVLVLSVLLVPAVVVLTVLAVLVLVDSRLITGAFCAARGSVPTRASSSSVASIARGAPCWRRCGGIDKKLGVNERLIEPNGATTSPRTAT